jgi:hypothetical protein
LELYFRQIRELNDREIQAFQDPAKALLQCRFVRSFPPPAKKHLQKPAKQK